MGTAKIAELPSNPPRVSDKIVVGSSVATESRLDDDDSAADVKISVGSGAAFNGVAVADDDEVEMDAIWVVEGTNANADETRARQKRSVVVILCVMVIKMLLSNNLDVV